MSDEALEKIRSQALSLSESERAELAHSLIASLDGAADRDVGSAWDAEIVLVNGGPAQPIHNARRWRPVRCT